jgi:hypothetical protein
VLLLLWVTMVAAPWHRACTNVAALRNDKRQQVGNDEWHSQQRKQDINM